MFNKLAHLVKISIIIQFYANKNMAVLGWNIGRGMRPELAFNRYLHGLYGDVRNEMRESFTLSRDFFKAVIKAIEMVKEGLEYQQKIHEQIVDILSTERKMKVFFEETFPVKLEQDIHDIVEESLRDFSFGVSFGN